MLYPVYLHLGDATHAHGMTFPDFPGCFAAADSMDDLAKAAQEAVEVYCEGEDMEVPEPSSLEELAESRDFEGGIWMLLDIDTSKLDTKTERINITVRARDLAKIDDYVTRAGGNRSGFLVESALIRVKDALGSKSVAADRSPLRTGKTARTATRKGKRKAKTFETIGVPDAQSERMRPTKRRLKA